jgi:hypothetical protein
MMRSFTLALPKSRPTPFFAQSFFEQRKFQQKIAHARRVKITSPLINRKSQTRRPVTNAKEVAVENRAEETYYHRTLSLITEPSEER